MKKLSLAVAVILLWGACKSDKNGALLPIAGNRDVVVKVVDGKTVIDTVYHTIPAFKTVNQYGDSVTNKSLDGNIYVADFFFTTCPSICPVMHRNMLTVYKDVQNIPNVKIISYTIDPKHDSVDVLKQYADKLGIAGNKWWLLRGNKEEIYQLASSYLVSSPQDDVKEKFIHDGFFILIDKQKRIRGQYDGTQPDQVKKLLDDINTLKAEPEQK